MQDEILHRHFALEPVCQHFLFFLTVQGCAYSGARQVFVDKTLREEKYGLLHYDMLLGRHHSFQCDQRGMSLYYWPLSDDQKAAVIQEAIADKSSFLQFPFALLNNKQVEIVAPSEYWNVSDVTALGLDAGEQHLRSYTLQILKDLGLPYNASIYDPACSTGRLLASIQELYQQYRVVGADISSSMVALASQHIDDVICLPPQELSAPAADCDVLILRFLNAQVITREEAEKYFFDLTTALRSGAYILVFGYTPVLPSILFLAQRCHLQLKQAIGHSCGQIFEYYVLQKE